MNQPVIQLVGRITPMSKVSLEQKFTKVNKMQFRNINQDIILDPLLDVTPFSEILNHRKLMQTIQPIQYVETIPQERLPSRPSRTLRSPSQSAKSIFESQRSVCSCSNCGCNNSRKRSTARRTQPRVPTTQQVRNSNKSQSVDSISQKKTRKHTSSASSKQQCEYHHYNRTSGQQSHHSRKSFKPSVNPEVEKLNKQQEYKAKQVLLRSQYSAKSLNPQTKAQVIKVPWLANVKKIEEGKLKKSRMQETVRNLLEQAQQSTRHRSQHKNTDVEEQKRKQSILDARKARMSTKVSIVRSKGEEQRLKSLADRIKKQKKANEDHKLKKQEQLKLVEAHKKQHIKECKNKPFKPTEQQIESAFV